MTARRWCCAFVRRPGVRLPIVLALALLSGCANKIPAECTPLGRLTCPVDLQPQGDGEWAVTCGGVMYERVDGICYESPTHFHAGCVEAPGYEYEPAPCPNGSGEPHCVWLNAWGPCDE